ncbi:MAG: hypothetical protein AB9866_12830 [Syntrophobacteraceae bacterium]
MKRTLLLVLLLLCFAGTSIAADVADITGKYISKQEVKEYIMLYPDRTFHLKQRRIPASIENPFVEISGKYRVMGNTVILMLPDQGKGEGEGSLKLEGNTLEDDEGTKWVKEGSEHKPVERAKRLKW